jgi:hypothetical protein
MDADRGRLRCPPRHILIRRGEVVGADRPFMRLRGSARNRGEHQREGKCRLGMAIHHRCNHEGPIPCLFAYRQDRGTRTGRKPPIIQTRYWARSNNADRQQLAWLSLPIVHRDAERARHVDDRLRAGSGARRERSCGELLQAVRRLKMGLPKAHGPTLYWSNFNSARSPGRLF